MRNRGEMMIRDGDDDGKLRGGGRSEGQWEQRGFMAEGEKLSSRQAREVADVYTSHADSP
jgi:hypothetical protein